MGAWTLDSTVGIVCEVAFTTGPLATPVWTDVSSYLDSDWESFRGKESEDDELQPGWLTVAFDNTARTFDPEHAAGPFFGNLKPMKKIRMRVAVGAFSAVIWTGYVLGWPQDWGVFKSVASVQCVDGGRIDKALAASAFEKAMVDTAPDQYWPLQDDEQKSALSGGPDLTANSDTLATVDLTTSEGDYPVGGSDFLDLSSAGSFANSNIGMARVATTIPAAISFWGRGGLSGTSSDYFLFLGAQSSTTFFGVYVNGAGNISLAYSHAADNLQTTGGVLFLTGIGLAGSGMHFVNVYRSGSNLVVMIDGTVRTTIPLVAGSFAIGGTAPPFWSLSAARPTIVDPSVGISHVAGWTTAPSTATFASLYAVGKYAFQGEYGGARINRALDEVGWPSGDRDVQPGGTVQASYRPDRKTGMEYIRDVERSEHPGVVFFSRDGKLTFRDRQWLWTRTPAITFSDTGTGIDYIASNPRGNDVSTIRNVVTVSYNQVGAITNREASSVTDYGEQPIGGELIECPTMESPQDASNLGRFRTRTRGQPQTIIPTLTAEMVPNPGTQIPAICGLELGDVVAFQRTPMSVGSAIVKKFIVLGIGHRVTAHEWTTTLYLSPPIKSATDAPYLVLGDATLGKVGAAFGNIVPF